jgi:beta-glucanase (GH16 family)
MAGIRALLGLFPKTSDYESKQNHLESEYKSLLAFKNSKELRKYHELEEYLNSEEFHRKKKELFSLRFRKTEDFEKEKDFQRLQRAQDIRVYYKIKDSEDLKSFKSIEKSSDLKNYYKLEEFIKSEKFAEVKKETSCSPRQKFEKSDLHKTLEQYKKLKNDPGIKGYYKFINHKLYSGFLSYKDSGELGHFKKLEKEINSAAFQSKLASLKKEDLKASSEKKKLDEYKAIRKSKGYKNYKKLSSSSLYHYYDKLHDSNELEVFNDLKNFITSENFYRQKKEIETFSFKDTEEYTKLQEYQNLKKSEPIQFYFKFKDSKAYKTYLALKGSERILKFESAKEYIESDEFKKFKAYCLKSPRKRWSESKEFEQLQEFKTLKKSENIVWYFRNIDAKRFSWHRKWDETFHEDFSSGKLDTKKWLTSYYWGKKMMKDSYSLSSDKHYITDGKNLNIENGKMHIVTRKEVVKGKSWDSSMGFITREFGYTSGLISTGESFRQKYGTFEVKMKIHEAKDLQNASWLVAQTMVPHIDISKAGKKLFFGNVWGNPRDLKSLHRFSDSLPRGRFSKDYFIYTLEWLPNKLTWKINGVEVTSTNKGIPQETMYLVFSSGLHKDVSGILPATFDIDWIRCFQMKQE